jgi:hypothetical protein
MMQKLKRRNGTAKMKGAMGPRFNQLKSRIIIKLIKYCMCIFLEQPQLRNLSATVRRLLQSRNFSNQRPPFWSKISWINQLTQLFHHNERAVSCWLSRLSRLNLGPKRWTLFSLTLQTAQCTLLMGLREGLSALY